MVNKYAIYLFWNVMAHYFQKKKLYECSVVSFKELTLQDSHFE